VGGEVEFPPLSRSGRRTIRLLLPEADSLAPISFPPPAPGTRRVLFVDDEETVLRLAVQALEFSGYHARSCSSARECLDLLSHAPDSFDLIISDQRMPGLSGVEMIGALRADGNRTPVLLVSGSLNAVTERQLRELAPARFIAKPFTLAEMLQAVAELLAEPAAVS
jgi:CheY-like chemotaxis protein